MTVRMYDAIAEGLPVEVRDGHHPPSERTLGLGAYALGVILRPVQWSA
jgi:hypothetical protein